MTSSGSFVNYVRSTVNAMCYAKLYILYVSLTRDHRERHKNT